VSLAAPQGRERRGANRRPAHPPKCTGHVGAATCNAARPRPPP
jgi:hypothetical protein